MPIRSPSSPPARSEDCETSTLTATAPRERPLRVALAALVLALLALAAAALPPFLMSEVSSASPQADQRPTATSDPATSPKGLRGLVVRAKARKAALLAKREAEARAAEAQRAAAARAQARLRLGLLVGAILGGLAIVLAIAALARGESRSVSLAALVVGLLAALWIYALAALTLAILIALGLSLLRI